MSGFASLPLATIARVADSDEYRVTVEGGATEENINATDIVALIPVSRNSHNVDEYHLVSIPSKQAAGSLDSATTSEAVFSLRHNRISQPPKELSKFIINPDNLSFFRRREPNGIDTELSIIVSVKSGTCQAEAFFNDVVKPLLSLLDISDDHYQVYFTDSERWIADFASEKLSKKANQGISQSILLLSGDGGIIDILNGLYTHSPSPEYVKPRIGLLVLGTGNALANSSGLNIGSTKGLPSILHGSPRNIPTFICKCSPGSVLLVDEARKTEPLQTDDEGCGIVHGAVVASWCLHATLVADSDTAEYRKFGSERFAMAAKELLSPSDGSAPHKWKGKITTYHKSQSGTVQSKVLERKEHMYILATLVSNLEAALTISPESKPLDRQLRLVDFPPLSAAEVMSIFGMAYNGGKHVEHESVGYSPIEGLRIDFEESDARWRRICVDGKIIRVPEGGWVEVRLEDRDMADLMVAS